jgi:hypothetical protein
VEVAGATWEETTASPRNVCNIQHSILESQSSLHGRRTLILFIVSIQNAAESGDGIARWYASARRYRPLLEVKQVVNVTWFTIEAHFHLNGYINKKMSDHEP